MIIAVAVFVAAPIVVALLALTAPDGFEDERGFHRGRGD